MKVKSPLFSDSLFDKNLGSYADKDGFTSIKGQIKKLGSLIDGLSSIRENRDPFKTQAQIEIDYKASYEKAQVAAKDSLNRTINTIVAMQDSAHEKMLSTTKLNQLSPHAAEIRQVLRSFGDSEEGEAKREAFLSKAVSNGKADIINAIMNTPAELSFLSDTKVNKFVGLFIDTYAPEYNAEMAAISKAEEMLKLAHDAYVKDSEAMRDPTLEVKSETEKQRADEAEKAFNQAMAS
ncbi:MAG: hypothetical protein MK088_06610 [Alteromonas sp.]|jgi:hypothetical protein|nr:hypothetical protein [Gammaproteobacteria bacterium]MCH2256285.1 hypothetical protein [Alteromonas sp.]